MFNTKKIMNSPVLPSFHFGMNYQGLAPAWPTCPVYIDVGKMKIVSFLVQQICDNIWLNCAFNDTCMKFGTLLEYTFLVIFGYRAIADLTCDTIGSHFPIWPPS